MRILRRGILVLAASALPAVLAVSSTAAEGNQPWCAVYSTDMGRTSQCAYSSREQCQAAISGIGFCQRNQSSAARGDRRHRRR